MATPGGGDAAGPAPAAPSPPPSPPPPKVPYVPPPPRAPPRRRERPSALHREDAHARGGRLLLEAAAASAATAGGGPSASAAAAAALDRLVAVVRCALALLEEVRRPSADLLDTPVATLAYHRVAWREMGGGERGAEGNKSGAKSSSGAARLLLCAQEVCSFDPDAAPEDAHVLPPPMDGDDEGDAEGPVLRLAAAHWRAAPSASVVAPPSAARRLLAGGGGEAPEGPAAASLRVELRGTSEAWLRLDEGREGAGNGDGGGRERALAAAATEEERHEIELPALHLSDPLSPECALALEGALRVRCERSELEARLELARDGRVKGGALRALPAVAAALRRPGGGGGDESGKANAATTTIEQPMVQVGVFKGRWDEGGEVVAECPWLKPLAALAATAAGAASGGGGAGARGAGGAARLISLPVWRSSSSSSSASATSPSAHQPPRPLAPLRSIDLRALPPMQLGRLWSAVADAAAYPSSVGAGAAAARLAAALSERVGGLTLGRPAPRDVAGEGGCGRAERQQGPSGQEGGGGGSGDAELEAFDREADRAAGGGGKGGGGGNGKGGAGKEQTEAAAPRNVAPCYHAEHVSGRRLAWQLRHELLRQGAGGRREEEEEGAGTAK